MRLTSYLLKRNGITDLPETMPIELSTWKRKDLGRLTRKRKYTTGAEIGVWKGDFSVRLLKANEHLHLLCVDPYEPYEGWNDPKGIGVDAALGLEEARRTAEKQLRFYTCTLVRAHSLTAAKQVPNYSLDFVYLDGNHGYEAVLADLETWTRKIRRGGFIAGHDYRDPDGKPSIQVKAAVDEFTRTRRIVPWFILTADRTPSFLWEVR